MEWNEICIYTSTQGIDIICGFLIGHGIKGMQIEDCNDFDDFLHDTTIHWDYIDEDLMTLKDKESNIKFYLPMNAQGMEQFNEIKNSIGNLKDVNPDIDFGRLYIESSTINEEDWSTAWKKYYHKTPIGKKLIVIPCWEDVDKDDSRIPVILDPGMAFGTGTHETTRLCMELLEDAIKGGEKMLDVGTGSGILAITSLLLGAESAVGVDIDELAVKVAGENAELNGVKCSLTLFCGDLTQKVDGKFDVICANIVADVIIRLSKDVTNFMHKDSILLVSGIIDERCDDVKLALDKANLKIEQEISENGWVAIKLKLK